MINTRPFTENDLQFIPQLQPPDWIDVTPVYRNYLQADFCNPMTIELEGKVAGVGNTILHKDSVWLSHIIVNPNIRNKGIGTHLTQALIDSVKDHYDTILLIATPLGEFVYNKLHFETENEYIVFKREETQSNFAVSENIIPYQDTFKEQLLTLDQMISAEDREVSLSKHLPASSVYITNGIVEGYFIPGIGEGTIVANTPVAGIELMKLKFNSPVDKGILPAENKAGIEFLQQHGFKEIAKIKRMRLGKPISWQPDKIYNRVGGFLG